MGFYKNTVKLIKQFELIWLNAIYSNGGPGASSLFGLMTELGPFMLNDNSLLTDEYNRTGVPSLFYNEYGWSQVGSLLMFDWYVTFPITLRV